MAGNGDVIARPDVPPNVARSTAAQLTSRTPAARVRSAPVGVARTDDDDAAAAAGRFGAHEVAAVVAGPFSADVWAAEHTSTGARTDGDAAIAAAGFFSADAVADGRSSADRIIHCVLRLTARRVTGGAPRLAVVFARCSFIAMMFLRRYDIAF